MMIKKIKFDYEPKTKPFSHQTEAIDYVKRNNIVALFDEQGLGKTKILIDALSWNIRNKDIDKALIICKKHLIKTWYNEILKHSHLFPVIITGTKNFRGKSFLAIGQFYIVNYEVIIQDLDLIKLILKNRKFAIVLDEAQKIKNPLSKTAKAIFSIKGLGVKRVIMTGTPDANRPDDIWAQYYFLDNGKLFGTNFNTFKEKYNLKLKGIKSLEIYEDTLSKIREKINRNSIRRTKDILELPEKIYRDVRIELSDRQREIYNTAKDKLYYEIKNENGGKLIKNIDNYLVKLLRLVQIASNPQLIIDDYNEIPSKFICLDKLIDEIIKRGEKVIIWSSFRRNIRLLRNRYKRYGSLMIFGDITIKDRDSAVEKFMNDEEFKILVANPSAAKEGLTLTSANNAIYLDRNFKMDDYLQSQDRIHRIGQEKKCSVIKIIANDTIDEYIDEILEKKEIIAKYIVGDTSKMISTSDYLSKKRLIEILGGNNE